jgi:hypothetical protein
MSASGCVFVSLRAMKVKQLCGGPASGFRLFWGHDADVGSRLRASFAGSRTTTYFLSLPVNGSGILSAQSSTTGVPVILLGSAPDL